MNTTVQGQPIPSQMSDIKSYLQAGNSLTQLEALGLFRCFRLAARIEQLRKAGMNIKTEMCKDVTGKQYARYTLAKEVIVGARVRCLTADRGVHEAGVTGVVTRVADDGTSLVRFDAGQQGIDYALLHHNETSWWEMTTKLEVI